MEQEFSLPCRWQACNGAVVWWKRNKRDGKMDPGRAGLDSITTLLLSGIQRGKRELFIHLADGLPVCTSPAADARRRLAMC